MTSKDASTLLREAHGLKAAGRLDEAIGRYGEAVAAGAGQEGLLMSARCELALGRAAEAVGLAERARIAAPLELDPQIVLAEALLAAGDARRAADVAGDIRRRWSTSQFAIALQATAWRMLGDAHYHALNDYSSLVWTSAIDAPEGWHSQDAFVADLGRRDAAAMAALPLAIDGPIRRGLAKFGSGDDPVRGRNRGTYALRAIKRVSGAIEDHVTEHGWVSAICCVGPVRDVRVRFGRPAVMTKRELPADHVVDLSPGMLVLFPSYVWHGVASTNDDEASEMLVFDLAPGAISLPDHD